MVRSPHILVVEDDREIRTMVSRFLSKNGCRVTVAEDGRSMDRALGTAKIDLLVLDIMLPGEDGLSICRRLRTSSTLPVIMLTTTDDPREIERCHLLGCNSYIVKPVDYDKFAEAIKQLGMFVSLVQVPEINGKP